MLQPIVRTILHDEFAMIDGLHAVFSRSIDPMHAELFAQPRPGIDPGSVDGPAFEAFRDAIDRLMIEAAVSSPYFTWCGLTAAPILNAEEIAL